MIGSKEMKLIAELRKNGRQDITKLAKKYDYPKSTLYDLLHRLEQKGFLRSAKERVGRTERRVYRATPAGRKALAAAKTKVRELFGELFEDEEGGGS